MHKLLNNLADFFRDEWRHMFVIAIAVALPQCLVYADKGRDYDYIITDTIFVVGAYFFVASLMGKWGKRLGHLFFAFALFDFGISFGSYLANGQRVTIDTFYLVTGTNSDEVAAFFEFYFPPAKIALWLAAMVLLCVLYFSRRPVLRPSKGVSRICSILLIVATILCFPSLKREWREWCAKIIPLKYVVIVRMYEPFDKVGANRQDLPLKELSSDHPRQLVVVIGESFSKSHSSLYGYSHDTNPELSHLAEDGNLLTFTHCEAPAPFTHLAFKNMFSFWEGGEDNWYDQPTLFDVFSQKYHIRWVTNQQDHGIHENAQVAYANLSDTVWFACRQGNGRIHHDDVLLKPLETFSSDTIPSITFVNLMGQHEAFIYRYPKTWEHFKPSDYSELPTEQRKAIAQYDNATRYNDHVVARIFDLYKEKDALVIYFPDHGLDLYETSPDYCGHAREEDDPSSWNVSCQIPFFVYITDQYRANHPLQVEKLTSSVDHPFNTRDLIYALMEITGWEAVGKPCKGRGLMAEDIEPEKTANKP